MMKQQPAGTSPIKAFDVLVGSWATSGAFHGTDRTFRATDSYEWLAGGHFLLHHVDADMDGRKVKSLEIFAPGENGGAVVRSYDNSGNIGNSKAVLNGLSFQVDAGTERFRGNFPRDFSAIEGLWEQREGENWKPWLHTRLVRVLQREPAAT